MGEVYRAIDTRLKRQVAIKILPAVLAEDADRLARFRREAEVLASLNHPHIAAVYGLEEQDGTTALVMELVDGATLADRIAEAPMPIDEVLSIARQIAEALEAAHEQGIVHRDLKPANISIREDGTVKVLDFGLAKLTETRATASSDPAESPTVTHAAATAMGVILGTAAYMSPEQARGRPVDKRTDVWAFGAVVYEMLARRRAFAGEDIAEAMASVMTSTPDWSALPSDVPPAVVTLVQRCLEKDRRTRIGDIAVARFLLSEHGIAATSASKAPDVAPASGVERSRWQQAVPWALALIGLATAAAAVAWHGARGTEIAPAQPVRFFASLQQGVSLLTAQGTTALAVSPDGQRVAFAASRGGIQQIWIRSLDALDAQPVAGTEGGTQPFWSPDSRTIAFATGTTINAVDVLGGPVRRVCSAPSFFRGGTWSQSGVILYGSLAGGLFRVPASGGEPVLVTKPDGARNESAHRFPSFLPDGQHFLYSAFPSSTIWLGSLDGADAKRVAVADSPAQYAAPGYLLFVRQAVLLAQPFDANSVKLEGEPLSIVRDPILDLNGNAAFSASSSGTLVVRTGLNSPTTQMTWVDRSGRTLSAVGPRGLYRNPVLSPDGTRVAIEALDVKERTEDIWLIDLERGEPSRFTFDSRNDIWPVWSPDGARLAFSSDRRAGGYDLYVKPSNGGTAEELLLESGAEVLAAPLSWSPDNRFLIYRDFAPYSNMAILPLTGERTPRLYQQVDMTQAQGQVSPNGRWLAYHSGDGSPTDVFVQSFPIPGAKWQVSTGGGRYPKWRKDGKELYYNAPDGRIMAVSVAGDTALEIGTPVPLFAPHLSNGTSVGLGFRAQYDVTSDGRFLLNVSVEDAQASPLTVFLNWAAGLKR